MSLLIDDLVAIDSEYMSGSVKNMQVILATNVSEYYYMGSDKEIWGEDDFPNIAPPFQEMWIEWSNPGKSNSEGTIVNTGDLRRIGVRIQSYSDAGQIAAGLAAALKNGHSPDGVCKWLCEGSVYLRSADTGKPGFFVRIIWGVTDEGKRVGFNGRSFIIIFSPEQMDMLPPDGPERQDIINSAVMMLHVPFLTISMMHFKNIELAKGPPIPEALRKARQRRGKAALVRYSTLVIEPIKKAIREAGVPLGTGGAQALHVIRGHFKDYRARGLFGKLKGLYWWDSQSRGDEAVGTVVKNYDVKA